MPYFINIEYYNARYHKFVYSIIMFDIDNDKLSDVANEMVKEQCDKLGIDTDTNKFTIKVCAFNRV